MKFFKYFSSQPSKMLFQHRKKCRWRALIIIICIVSLFYCANRLYNRFTCPWQISDDIRGFVNYGYHYIKFSPDRSLIAITHEDNSKVVNWVNGEEISRLKMFDGQGISDFSSDSRIVGCFSKETVHDREAYLWNSLNGELLGRIKLPDRVDVIFKSPFFSPDNKNIIAICDNEVIFWDLSDLHRIDHIEIMQDKDSQRGTVTWHPINHKMTLVDTKGVILVVDLEKKTASPLFASQQRAVKGVSWSPDGTKVITIDRENETASVWNVQTGTRVTDFAEEQVIDAEFSPDGERVVTRASHSDRRLSDRIAPPLWNRRTCVWDARSGKLIQELSTKGIVSFSADWSYWADAGPRGVRIAKFDYSESCDFPSMFDGHGSTCVFSKDNTHLAYVNDSGRVIVFQLNRANSRYNCVKLPETWIMLLSIAVVIWCLCVGRGRQVSKP